jgi:hypothetical protein
MRKILLALSLAAATAFSTAASAQYYDNRHAATVGAGAVTGTVVGLGLSEGWWGHTALPSTVAGAAATGFVAGVGTVALIHAATTPCQGFHALFSGFLTSPAGCQNGQWVGAAAPAPVRRR